ncbi:hypothetical protein AC579_4958 [Pseudocercospora musae]|uniref:Uncharacterized protein n=1 Tax=Pseudocercospora musae TaxID=113226 RepID=A0A139I6W1_9PEZI|nr:hypothetical protein AC579_4958 [Pseudocercospora musae]
MWPSTTLPSPSRLYTIHKIYQASSASNQTLADIYAVVNNAFLDTAIPAQKDVPRMVLGMVELLTFFPNHNQWFQFMKRALRNKWSTEEMARMQLHARGQLTQDNFKTREAAMRHQVGVGGKAFYHNGAWTRTNWFASSHPDSIEFVSSPPDSGNNLDLYDISQDTPAWGPNSGNLSTALPTLYEVVDGVVNWPQGQDRGQLTQALGWAVQQGEQYLRSHDISNIPNIIATQQFRHPTNAGTLAWDARARTRMNQSVRKPAT